MEGQIESGINSTSDFCQSGSNRINPAVVSDASLGTLRTMINRRYWNRADWAIGLLVVGVAAILRFYALGKEPLWLDEGYSWWDIQQSAADLWGLVPQCDPHPPLYFFLLKAWAGLFGDGTAALRSLGAATGVITTACVIFAGREINRHVGWIAGLLFATAPFQIEFAHEARPYTLVCLGAALIAFGVLRIIRSLRADIEAQSGNNAVVVDVRVGWCALVLGGTIALWSNNTSVLILAALGVCLLVLFVLDPKMRNLVKPFVLAAIVVAVLWLPYVPTMIEQARGVVSEFWIPKPDAWRFAHELRFVIGLGSFTVLWLMVTIWVAGLSSIWRRGYWRETILLFGLALLPVLLNLTVSLLVKPIFLSRALIGIAPFFAIAIAGGLAGLDRMSLKLPIVGMLAAAQVLAAMGIYTQDHRKEPWDTIARQLMHDKQHDALVLMVPNELALPLSHAFQDLHVSMPMQGVPANFPAPGISGARYPSGKCTPSDAAQDLSSIGTTVRGHEKIFLITRRYSGYDVNNRVQAILGSLGLKKTALHEYFPGLLMVYEYVMPKKGMPR